MVPELLDEFFATGQRIKDLYKQKKEEASRVDIELSEFYHKVEAAKLDESISYSLILELQSILTRRRLIKYEVILLSATCDGLTNTIEIVKQNVETKKKKHVSIIKEIEDAGQKI